MQPVFVAHQLALTPLIFIPNPGTPGDLPIPTSFFTVKFTKMTQVGLLVRLVAKPGKEQQVADFIQGALPLAQQEPDTTTWYAIRIDQSTFGIFDTFPHDAGRQAHLSGPIAAALMANAAELLAEPPKIEPVDVLASK